MEMNNNSKIENEKCRKNSIYVEYLFIVLHILWIDPQIS